MKPMTHIQHHPTEALLVDYAAGTLPEAFALVLATHVSMCDDCRARLSALEAVGGGMLERMDCAALAEDSLEATLARISGTPPVPKAAAARRRNGIFPTPLRDYVGGDLDAVRWRPVGMGVRQAILPTASDARVRLLYIPAGSAVPDHGHRGMELTLVLQGAFRDDDGRYGKGDMEVATEAMEHTPVAEPGQDCICLAATDAPLRFRSFLPRIAQPLFRI